VAHDSHWAANFERESAVVRTALGDILVTLHHIGSTAIPGIVAKPVIDMLAVVTDVTTLDRRAPLLEEVRYEALGEFGILGRRYFRKDSAEGVRTHQMHAFAVGSPEIDRHLVFRDYMRAHQTEAEQYAELKQELARRFPTNMDAYTEGKTEFIREIERRAATWRTE